MVKITLPDWEASKLLNWLFWISIDESINATAPPLIDAKLSLNKEFVIVTNEFSKFKLPPLSD